MITPTESYFAPRIAQSVHPTPGLGEVFSISHRQGGLNKGQTIDRSDPKARVGVHFCCGAFAERVDAERMQVLLRGSSEVLPVSRSFTYLFRE